MLDLSDLDWDEICGLCEDKCMNYPGRGPLPGQCEIAIEALHERPESTCTCTAYELLHGSLTCPMHGGEG